MKNLSETKDINLPEISPRSALEEVLRNGARRLLQEHGFFTRDLPSLGGKVH